MFKGNSSTPSANYDVIIGSQSEVTGDIKSEGSVRVEGILTGNITTEGIVIVGPEARVIGNIESSSIEISGGVKGDIVSKGTMKIYKTGKLIGNINVASFQIDEGGAFEGQCHINVHEGSFDFENEQKDNVVELSDSKASNES